MSTKSEEIMDIINSLETNTSNISDQDIIQKINSWIPSYSCESAAKGYFMFVSTVLNFRPHLEDHLLIKAIEPLYYLGIDNAKDIISWVKLYQVSKEWYPPRKSGLMWLGTIHEKDEVIKKLLKHLSEEE